MECPECGAPMEFIEAEPDTGIMSSGWYCGTCEISQDADDPEGMTMRPKLCNDMRDAIEDAESALFGCEQIDWEEFEELFASMDDTAAIRPRITKGEMVRLHRALQRLNEIVNNPDYARIK